MLRARLLTPLDAGGTRYESDGVLVVDRGRPDRRRSVRGRPASSTAWPVFDLRPLVLLPGMVDLHVHLPQVPAAGVGAGLDLLTWLERHIFSLERAFRAPVAEQLVPAVYRAMAASGTTTILAYGAIWADSLDAAFRAAEAHGIRATLGAVMMDRLSYDDETPAGDRLDRSLRESDALCERWDGAADGRLGYAFTPRFAVSCSAELLRESAALAARHGAIWQTHLSEDAREIETVRDLFPEASDYLDVYDRAGGLGPRSVFAHAIHLVGRRARPARRQWFPDRALPGLEPVHLERRDAPREVPRGGRHRGSRLGRRRVAGALDPDPDAHRLLRPERLSGRDR